MLLDSALYTGTRANDRIVIDHKVTDWDIVLIPDLVYELSAGGDRARSGRPRAAAAD